jgi:hypothetical protein
MRKHNTPEEKLSRKLAYTRLREIGMIAKHAVRLRDWTDNKIDMICSGEAKPSGIIIRVNKRCGKTKKH